MRKFLRLGVVLAITLPGMMLAKASMAATVPDAARNVISCEGPDPDGTPGHVLPGVLGNAVQAPANPGVQGVPVLGSVVGTQQPCVDAVRTLVFVGSANVDDGVNFAGVGDSNASGTTHNYTFGGICVMVDWEDPQNSGASVDPAVTTCNFTSNAGTGSGSGHYYNPSQPNPVLNPIGTATGLGWAPASEASCVNSSGDGIQTFTSNGALGTTDTWTSSFAWQNSLDNLRGRIQAGTTVPGAGAGYVFDAKIETAADTAAAAQNLGPALGTRKADVFDLTDAGCLQKNLAGAPVNAAALGNPNGAAQNGLNYILVAGTASWNTRAPRVLGN